MKCPKDKTSMIVLEYNKIELDYCLVCSGIWLDSGELESLLQRPGMQASDFLNVSSPDANKANPDEATYQCSICHQQMVKLLMGKQSLFQIDKCPQCEGFWFDAGELDQILEMARESESSLCNDVVSFVEDALKSIRDD